MNALWALCGKGSCRKGLKLEDALSPKYASKALFFTTSQSRLDSFEAAFSALCTQNHLQFFVVLVESAEQALLDHYCVTTVPMCVFIIDNQWTYLMPSPTIASIKAFCTTLASHN